MSWKCRYLIGQRAAMERLELRSHDQVPRSFHLIVLEPCSAKPRIEGVSVSPSRCMPKSQTIESFVGALPMYIWSIYVCIYIAYIYIYICTYIYIYIHGKYIAYIKGNVNSYHTISYHTVAYDTIWLNQRLLCSISYN